MVWPAALESPRVTLCMTQPPSIAAHRIATAQRLSHLDLFITTASTAVRAPVLIGSASAWRLQDREFDQAHAAVVGILPFDKRCLLQPIDRDADRSFGTDRIDRQWSRAGGAAGLVLEIHRRGRSGLVIIMIGATIVMWAGGMVAVALMYLVVKLLAAFVAYGRWRLAPYRDSSRPAVLRPARVQDSSP